MNRYTPRHRKPHRPFVSLAAPIALAGVLLGFTIAAIWNLTW